MIDDKQNFTGLNGFVWFMGVVEDRDDPYLIGRVKVRCFGHHTSNIQELPTKDLPWAQVMLPVTSAGISGIGQSPIGLVEGSHVFGFFRDGEDRQELVVMGSLPGYPAKSELVKSGIYTQEQANTLDILSGFSDPKGVYPKYTGAPDTNQLSTMIQYNPLQHSSIDSDIVSIKGLQNIGTASFEGINLASNYVVKGGFSLIGFVTDVVSAFAGDIFNQIDMINFNSTGLGQITQSVTTPFGKAVDFAKGLADPTTGLFPDAARYLQTTLGVPESVIASATFNEISTGIGKLGTEIVLSELPEVAKLAGAGMSLLSGTPNAAGGIDYKLKIDSPATMARIYIDAAEEDVINAFNEANQRVKSGLDVVEGIKSKVVDTTVLGYKAARDIKEAVTNQETLTSKVNQELGNIHAGGTDTMNVAKDKFTGLTTGLSEDEHQDSHSQKALVAGDMGINIPQKGITNELGVSKLMNNFISADKSSWSVPNIPLRSNTYPYKHVMETESGHTMIYDDTPGNESIMQRHMSGTQYFIANDGSKTDIVKGDKIDATIGSRYSIIREDDIISLDGRYKILVNLSGQRGNNYDIVVGPGANVNIQVDKGDVNMVAKDGRINMECSDDFNLKVGGDMAVKVDGDLTCNSDGDTTLKGSKIFLN